MKVCLLTHHRNFASKRLSEEAARLSWVLEIKDAHVFQWQLPGTTETFDITLNRLSAVQVDSLWWALLELPMWGRQVNPWPLRQKLWDKARQAVWMQQAGWPSLPVFIHRGALRPEDESWRKFVETNARGGFVFKLNRGQRGVGVHFIQTEAEVLRWMETFWRMNDQDFLIQPQVKVEREYRITFLQGRVWAVLERKGEGPANFAQGGEANELKTWSKDLEALLGKMSRTKADFLSIDVLESANGLHVIDINTVPGFEQLEAVTGRNFARDFLSTLKGQE